jgi:hypothetical protein
MGDHARIGANAVVLRDVPAFSLAVGVPATIVALKHVRRKTPESTCTMNLPLVISASLVLYKPDLADGGAHAAWRCRRPGALPGSSMRSSCRLTLVDNSSDDAGSARQLAEWLEGVRPAVPDWTLDGC